MNRQLITLIYGKKLGYRIKDLDDDTCEVSFTLYHYLYDVYDVFKRFIKIFTK